MMTLMRLMIIVFFNRHLWASDQDSLLREIGNGFPYFTLRHFKNGGDYFVVPPNSPCRCEGVKPIFADCSRNLRNDLAIQKANHIQKDFFKNYSTKCAAATGCVLDGGIVFTSCINIPPKKS